MEGGEADTYMFYLYCNDWVSYMGDTIMLGGFGGSKNHDLGSF